MDRQAGVTLLETMVAVSISAIVLVVGIPSMIEFTRNVRRDAQVLDVLASLSFARSEAIKRGIRVTACPSANLTNCLNSRAWEGGWIVFADVNGDGEVNEGDDILQTRRALEGENTLRGGRQKISYQWDGFSQGYNDTLRLCDARGMAHSKRIIINMQGRARVAAGSSTCP